MRFLLIAVAAVFSTFTFWVLAQTGPVGFYEQLLGTPAGMQVFADIAIALVLVLTWMWRDADASGRNRGESGTKAIQEDDQLGTLPAEVPEHREARLQRCRTGSCLGD